MLVLALLLQAQYFSVPQVDAPELARFGSHDVGVRTIEITNPQQPDILKSPATLADRSLKIEIWYPAQLKANEQAHTVYVSPMVGRASRPEMPKTFDILGKALRDAQPKQGAAYPMVVVSHGYPGSRTFLSYLTENLASKGYIVAAIDHTDSVFGEVRGFPSTLIHRSPDQIFTIQELTRLSMQPGHFLSGIVDSEKVAIVGYSMGGYGAMASGGASYNANSGMLKQIPMPKITPPANLKAIVAIAPWGAQPPVEAWSEETAKGLKLPSLFIAGDNDDVSGYEQGVKKLYNWSTNSNRCMLTYRDARHNLGGNPAPANVPLDFQARESFEEPVWRKDRITAINQHYITAFLDLNLKSDETKAAYLKPDGKGFQPRWFLGLNMDCQKPN
jgi:dienelactone hydrolase